MVSNWHAQAGEWKAAQATRPDLPPASVVVL
jgi:hypothetical protein